MGPKQQRQAPWRNAERHYCATCNAWMGSDRQSIALHENGKKHRENVEKSLQKKRDEKLNRDKEMKDLQRSLQKIEQAALQSHLSQDGMLSSYASISMDTPGAVTSAYNPSTGVAMQETHPVKKEKSEWASRKRKQKQGQEDQSDLGGHSTEPSQITQKRQKLEPGVGHYDCDGRVYLEAIHFFGILEEDMPVQVWTGPLSASLNEKRLPEKNIHWTEAIVAAARKTDDGCIVHLAYFSSPDQNHETLEKNVDLERIRIILGSHECIPESLEEARLLQMGGEEVSASLGGAETESNLLIHDETTGLSGWSTVSVKRTTARQEMKEERLRQRENEKREQKEKRAQLEQVEARRLEEVKVADADDSALGAFDVWGKGGYKGIDITATDKVQTVDENAKGLAGGKKNVGFKKKKRPPSNRNQRVTSAEDL